MPIRPPTATLLAVLLGAAAAAAAPTAVLAQGAPPGQEEGEAAADPALLEMGRQVFTAEAVPQCGICHTLAAAGAEGAVGPDLDALQPSREQVRLAVSGGVGIMPAYADILTEGQI